MAGEAQRFRKNPPGTPRPSNGHRLDSEQDWAAIRQRHRDLVDRLTIMALVLSPTQMANIASEAEETINTANGVMADQSDDASTWQYHSAA